MVLKNTHNSSMMIDIGETSFDALSNGFHVKEEKMGQTIEVSIDNHGGILLPQELKTRLGLLPGMTMVVEEDDEERVCLRVRTESPELVDKQGIIVVRAESSEDLTNVTRRARDRRVSDLLHRAEL
jgi:bifunctional DNA-binding transcriptional regulator/antitoxin component of YhaV-PrlF toxin-antitoxin module